MDDDNGTTNGTGYGVCDPDKMAYIPTVEEYREALGGYGVTFVTIGSLTTALLYILFFQQMWHTFSNTHKAYRRHIYWLISVYPFVTLMSTIALVVPRANQICTAVKITYMSIGVGHFADLTVLMYGSENKMISDVKDTPMNLALLPLCCCCRCLPQLQTSKLRLSVTKWMIWQLKWTQCFYFVLKYIIFLARQDTECTASVSGKFLYLNFLNFASFLSGVWALNILNALSMEHLARFRYRAKSLAVKLLILFAKLQGFIFDVLGTFRVFPCLGPNITPIVYQNTLENSIFLVEMLIFGLFSYVMYRRVEFKQYEVPNEDRFVCVANNTSVVPVDNDTNYVPAVNNTNTLGNDNGGYNEETIPQTTVVDQDHVNVDVKDATAAYNPHGPKETHENYV